MSTPSVSASGGRAVARPEVRDRAGGSRDALIQAAVSVVAEQGLSALTYRSLARKAGVTHGAVQHHFSSIDDVLEAAMTKTVEESLSELQGATSPSSFVDNVRDFVRNVPDVQAFQYQVALESRSRQSLRPLVLELYRSYWAGTEAALRARGVEPDPEIVRAVFAAGEGIIYQHAVLGDDDPGGVEQAIEGLRRLIEAVFPDP